jgi:uncharacterized protein YuzE
MQIDYDPRADALYILLREGTIDQTLEVGQHVYVDVDSEGIPLGVELLFAGRFAGQDELTSVTVNVGPIEKRHDGLLE